MTKNDIQFLAKTQIVYQYEIINGIFMSGNINQKSIVVEIQFKSAFEMK